LIDDQQEALAGTELACPNGAGQPETGALDFFQDLAAVG